MRKPNLKNPVLESTYLKILNSKFCKLAHYPFKLLAMVNYLGFPGGSEVKNPPANAGDTSSIPGSGKSPGEGNDNPFQYPPLENPMDRGA